MSSQSVTERVATTYEIPQDVLDKADAIMAKWPYADPLEYIGEGCFKATYGLAAGYVLKVGNGCSADKGNDRLWFEYEIYLAAVDAGDAESFPATVWGHVNGRNFMVQEHCDMYDYDSITGDMANNLRAVGDRLGIGDLHGQNVGATTDERRPVILDWGAPDFWYDGSAGHCTMGTATAAMDIWKRSEWLTP